MFPWFHYVNEKNVALWSICRSRNLSGHLKLSNKKDGAFLTGEFSNWEKAVKKFQAHEKSKCHNETLSMEVIRHTNHNVSGMISADAISEKLQNRQMLLQILENVRFLSRQGLPLRGNNKEGNFDQMLMHASIYDPRLAEWLQKKRGEYTHPDSQNEFLKIMSLSMLTEIASNI